MWNKPFKPLTVKERQQSTLPEPIVIRSSVEPESDHELSPRPTKKRRLIHVVDDCNIAPIHGRASSRLLSLNVSRKPLEVVSNASSISEAPAQADGLEGYYVVLWFESIYLSRIKV